MTLFCVMHRGNKHGAAYTPSIINLARAGAAIFDPPPLRSPNSSPKPQRMTRGSVVPDEVRCWVKLHAGRKKRRRTEGSSVRVVPKRLLLEKDIPTVQLEVSEVTAIKLKSFFHPGTAAQTHLSFSVLAQPSGGQKVVGSILARAVLCGVLLGDSKWP